MTAGDPDNVCCFDQAIQVIHLLRLVSTRSRPLFKGTYVATSEPTVLTTCHGSAFLAVSLGWKHRPGRWEGCRQCRSHLLLLLPTNQNRRSGLLKDLQPDLRDGWQSGQESQQSLDCVARGNTGQRSNCVKLLVQSVLLTHDPNALQVDLPFTAAEVADPMWCAVVCDLTEQKLHELQWYYRHSARLQASHINFSK